MRPILIIEDSLEDLEVLRLAFNKLDIKHPLVHCVTGDDAIEYLEQNEQLKASHVPLLILLDLNLPGMDGRQVLKAFKASNRFRLIPVIVLTTSSNPKDIRQCYATGANAYMVKPVNLEKFFADLGTMCQYWFDAVTLPESEDV